MAFSALEIGKRGLMASKLALDITSNNIANVNTEGYSRRVAVLSETDPYQSINGFMGTGVLVDKIRNFREEFFDKEIRSTETRMSAFETDTNLLKRIEAILAEPSDLGLNETIAKFLNSFEDLATAPEDVSLRQNTLMVAQEMIDRFNTTAAQLNDLKTEIVQSSSSGIDKANQLLKEISGLNNEIQKSIAHDSSGAQTYVDQRELKLEELSRLMETTVTSGEFGTKNVFVNGINVITGNIYSSLKLKEKINTETGETSLQLTKVNSQNAETALKVIDGELGSLLKNYNITLNSQASTGDFSISKGIDDLVFTLANKVNNLTKTGYGLDDKISPAKGINFFDSTSGKIDASTIKLSDDVLGKPRNIPLSGASNEPGNSDIARAIGKLSVDKTFLNNQTPSGYYTNLTGQLGQLSNAAQNGSSTTGIVSEQLKSQRESIIGVNLDEEAVNLIKFQKSFEASSRIINTTNEMLTTIVNLGR